MRIGNDSYLARIVYMAGSPRCRGWRLLKSLKYLSMYHGDLNLTQPIHCSRGLGAMLEGAGAGRGGPQRGAGCAWGGRGGPSHCPGPESLFGVASGVADQLGWKSSLERGRDLL